MNPWQYEHGVCNSNSNDAAQKKTNLLSWQLINSISARVNKSFVAINIAKCLQFHIYCYKR